MARLPWFPFYPADWFRDTKCLSFAAKGAWADLLGILWDSKTRGTKTFDLDTWASELGKSRCSVEAVFSELQQKNIAEFETDGNGAVTVMSRRQVREEKAHEHTRSRVSDFRKRHSNVHSNAPVTLESQKSEVRSQSQSQNQKNRKRDTLSMPENWILTTEMTAYAASKGMTPATVPHEFEDCKDHHAESKFTERGWNGQVWRTWVRKWISFGRKQVLSIEPSIPKAFRKLDTIHTDHQPMPDDVRTLLAQAGKGKGMPV